jgi:hypothetical protein
MNRFFKYFFIVWAINLVLFFILTAYLGGDAINGKIIDGRYFLSSHGRLTEVSHRVFIYSEVHTVIFIVLGVLAMPLAMIKNRQKNKKGQDGHFPSTQV